MTFIAASWCNDLSRKGLADAISQIVQVLGEEAKTRGLTVHTIGIALDTDIPTGLRTVNRFGRFKEVAVGGNWRNLAARRYLLGDLAGAPTLPQVIVTKRMVRMDGTVLTAEEEKLLARFLGSEDIVRWSGSSRIQGLLGHVDVR